jgi:hypothetical protein
MVQNQTMISNDGNGSIVRSSVLQLMLHHKTIHVLIPTTMEYYTYIYTHTDSNHTLTIYLGKLHRPPCSPSQKIPSLE